jgi:hypothetical protein
MLHPDIRGAITTRITHLVGACRTGWLFTEINVEVLVNLQAAVVGVTINLQQIRTSTGKIRIELVVPTCLVNGQKGILFAFTLYAVRIRGLFCLKRMQQLFAHDADIGRSIDADFDALSLNR